MRPRYLRPRKITGQRPVRPGPPAGHVPWWRSKWWHIAILTLCTLIFLISLIILTGAR